MSQKNAILAVVAVLAIVLLLWLAYRSQHTLESDLPERVVCASQTEALLKAGPKAYPVLGSGSMAPFIPAAPAGQDPFKTIVAYAVTSDSDYNSITPGKLVIYRTPASPVGLSIHGAALQDSNGWIMSGLHNERSESWARVTPSNFVAIVSKVYVW